MDAAVLEKAGQTLFDQVYVPAFMQKCAERGVIIRDEDELRTALHSVHMLRNVKEAQALDAGRSLHKAANVALRRRLGENVEATEKSEKLAREARDASLYLQQDAGVVKAAELLCGLTAGGEGN